MRRFTLFLAIFLLAFGTNTSVSAQFAPQFTDLVLEVNSSTGVKIYGTIGGTVIRTMGYGERFLWNGASQTVNQRTWIPVYLIDTRTPGFASPENGTLYQVDTFRTTPGMNLAAGGTLAAQRILYSGAAVTSAQLGTLPVRTTFTVMDGPQFNQLYVWWQIKTSTGLTGWVIDTPATLEVTNPLKVYGLPVCDDFNIRAYGVAGWDSFTEVLQRGGRAAEVDICLASANLKGDGTPIVTLLTRVNPSTFDESQVVRSYELVNGAWSKIFEVRTQPGERTERLGVYDLIGSGTPGLLWLTRNDGTGNVLNVRGYQYNPVSKQLQQIFKVEDIYKGNVQVGVGNMLILQPVLKADEANCCPSGYRRTGFQWNGSGFAQVIDDQPLPPYLLQQGKGG
jgi:hypothetical protein